MVFITREATRLGIAIGGRLEIQTPPGNDELGKAQWF